MLTLTVNNIVTNRIINLNFNHNQDILMMIRGFKTKKEDLRKILEVKDHHTKEINHQINTNKTKGWILIKEEINLEMNKIMNKIKNLFRISIKTCLNVTTNQMINKMYLKIKKTKVKAKNEASLSIPFPNLRGVRTTRKIIKTNIHKLIKQVKIWSIHLKSMPN